MSTHYTHFGKRTIKEVVNKTNWILGDNKGTLSIDEAIESGFFYITNGNDYLWVKTDTEGVIHSFARFGGNKSDFLLELIGYSVSEYEYDSGMLGLLEQGLDEDSEEAIEAEIEFSNWLEDNTFNKNDEK